MKTANEIPIAYQSGHAGPLIHVMCWQQHDAETLARTGNKAYLGTLVFTSNKLAEHQRCGFCGKPIVVKGNPNQSNPEVAPVGGQHTPTPWHFETRPHDEQDHETRIMDSLGNVIFSVIHEPAYPETLANARFICRAVNSHAALVAALRRMMNTHGAHGPCSGNDCRDCGAAYQQARAVLASVEDKR